MDRLTVLGRSLHNHYHYDDEQVPEAGASELERTYERKDYGFVVEHRWQEKITNIVTLAGFLKARDELLDLCLPVYTEAIEKIFGKDYDVSRLVNHLRTNGRRFLENASLILYDAAAQGRVIGDDGMLDVVLTKHLFEEAERCALDRKLLEIFELHADKKESERRLNAFLAQLVVQYFRHPDGAAVTAAEADALIQAISNNHRYEQASQEQEKRIEELLRGDKQLEKRVK